jgi:hypothetical protein
MRGEQTDLRSLMEDERAQASDIEGAPALLAFSAALVGGDEAVLGPARTRVEAEIGAERLVDTAAVVSNFERMVRIADATGIALDRPLEEASTELRAELGLDDWRQSKAS